MFNQDLLLLLWYWLLKVNNIALIRFKYIGVLIQVAIYIYTVTPAKQSKLLLSLQQ